MREKNYTHSTCFNFLDLFFLFAIHYTLPAETNKNSEQKKIYFILFIILFFSLSLFILWFG